MILLQAIDQRWKEHLLVIDKLKEHIGLRGYSGKDPLIEYKKEAFEAFEKLKETIEIDVIEKVMKIQIVAQDAEQALQSLTPVEADLDELDYQSPDSSQASSFAPTRNPERPGNGNGGSPQKQKMTFSNRPLEDSKMNRAERRKMQKDQRKR